MKYLQWLKEVENSSGPVPCFACVTDVECNVINALCTGVTDVRCISIHVSVCHCDKHRSCLIERVEHSSEIVFVVTCVHKIICKCLEALIASFTIIFTVCRSFVQ